MESPTRRFRLDGLLGIRRDAEEAATRALGEAVAARVRAEAEQARLDRGVVEARERFREARERFGGAPPASAGEAEARDTYGKRLRDAVGQARKAAGGHRERVLAPTLAAEKAAAEALAAARREREALETVKARREAAARQLSERRAEDAASDLALAGHARRGPDR